MLPLGRGASQLHVAVPPHTASNCVSLSGINPFAVFESHNPLTTQAVNLTGRLPSGPIRVQRPDKSCYMEASQAEVSRLIEAGIVEGIGPRSGRIDLLRITVPQDEAVERLAKVTRPETVVEKPGSITSGASREVFREILADGVHWIWSHKLNRGLERFGAVHRDLLMA